MTWMTPEEVSEYLKIHRNTVYDYIKRGIFPAVKFGKYYRIPKEELDSRLKTLYEPKKQKEKQRFPIL